MILKGFSEKKIWWKMLITCEKCSEIAKIKGGDMLITYTKNPHEKLKFPTISCG